MPADRLSALDTAFLCIDRPTAPMHMGAVGVFSASRPHDHRDAERLAALVAERAERSPRLRLRLREGRPWLPDRWEPDPRFDAAAHVGSHHVTEDDADPLAAHASRWFETPLDPRAPLWNAEVVTGLPRGRFALLLKFHHALCDGAGAAELALGLLDEIPSARSAPATAVSADTPGDEDTDVLSALWRDARRTVGETVESLGIATAMLRAARPFPLSPTAIARSTHRRLGFVRLDTSDVRRVRKAYGGTPNDVMLAVLAGALREWLRGRNDGNRLRPLRALVPVSTRRRRGDLAGGNALSGYLCDLPVDVDDPLDRLRAVTASMNRHKRAGPWRGAGAFPVLAERLPSVVHRLATRTVSHAAPVLFDTVITTVPLPGLPLSLDGAPLRETYPVVPLAPHQAVGFAVSTYRDGVHVGLNTGGDAVHQVGALADAVTKSMATLAQHCP
ncbi:wax ester/triacylglycerol synthase family O-acyltransferase [Saccharomonospora glauca]|jgi:diacylglycerol O-acyltransferase|uniref:Diacylglycerol O-acyltransferase n=1 Tax=Saccharomonospora glauca K62 TaxID=928724 RepID=I1D517_9PSEU|nr:wax ester/triacylglycerol synthase family O-acyltransferase [Saccharomonospora glauca]EIF00042.1 acyltransferase, WS/DGAT/MGAT [Saccharomonospora glauca K62]